MRGKVSQARSDDVHYSYSSLSSETEKRLDLNDLLKRAAYEKNRDKKFNLLIFSGASTVVMVFLLLLNL